MSVVDIMANVPVGDSPVKSSVQVQRSSPAFIYAIRIFLIHDAGSDTGLDAGLNTGSDNGPDNRWWDCQSAAPHQASRICRMV